MLVSQRQGGGAIDACATLMRVASFRHALTHTEELREFDSRIEYGEAEAGTISISELRIVSSAGSDVLKEKTVVVRAGERVLIIGAPGTGKTLLFRALAGLWPWGSGKVGHPKDETIFYLPRGTPYLPRGTLREVLAYPSKVDGFGAGAFEQALHTPRRSVLIEGAAGVGKSALIKELRPVVTAAGGGRSLPDTSRSKRCSWCGLACPPRSR